MAQKICFIMRMFKKIMISFFFAVVLLAGLAFIFVHQTSFGKNPQGRRLERIKKSFNYSIKEGNFKNLSETPIMAAYASYFKLLKAYIWKKNPTEPDEVVPYTETDLKSEAPEKPRVIWFGHSTYLIQIKGKNILMDPVFSERTSPVQYAGSKRYAGTERYSLADFPRIDFVIISHDHYDHLDYGTISQLDSKGIKFFTPLGVGAHLESWGIADSQITEFDWWEGAEIAEGLKLTATPARHFSGRSITNRNSTLWASFVLSSQEYCIYLGGDSGYDTHFKVIGDKFGPFDLVILECGQYHPYWPNIHMMPEETVQAAIDLRGKILLPVHWGKFTLALHSWNDPINRVEKKAKESNVRITTPMIGESLVIDSFYPHKQWWRISASN
jgi:L-ascorbate metabolism protein UlaG (beta-lactamase superfamily)